MVHRDAKIFNFNRSGEIDHRNVIRRELSKLFLQIQACSGSTFPHQLHLLSTFVLSAQLATSCSYRAKTSRQGQGREGRDVAVDDRHKGRGQEAIDETSHLGGPWLPDGEIFYSLPYSVVKFKPSILGPPSRGLGLNLMGAM